MASQFNPWKGLSSYDEGEILYGRDKDIENLFSLISTNQEITILYGKSGIGKTSLLKAGLFPWLRSSHILPVYVRLEHTNTDKSYIQQVIETVENEVQKYNIKHTDLASDTANPKSLWEFLHRYDFHTEEGIKCTPMIFFDQFEEIFTVSSNRPEKVEEFINDLGNILNETTPDYLLKSLDEDTSTFENIEVGQENEYKAENDDDLDIDLEIDEEESPLKTKRDFLLAISIREDYIFNLDRISASIPSLKRNRYFLHGLDESGTREAIEYPVKNLIDDNVTSEIINVCHNDDDKYINPAFLSLLMYNLFERMKQKGLSTITSSLVRDSKGVIFYTYYVDSVKDLSDNTIDFIENRLVSAGGFRLTVSVDDAKAADVTDQEIKQLEARRLIVPSNRGDKEFIELTHDLLCPEILKYKGERDKIKKARQNRRRTIIFSSIIAIVLAIAAVFIWQTIELNKREKAWLLNQSRAVAAQAEQLNAEGNSQLATLLALEVLPKDLNNPDRPYSFEAERALRKSLLYNDAIIKTSAPIRSMDVSPNGEVVVVGYNNGNLGLWDIEKGVNLWETSFDHDQPIVTISFNQDGKKIISVNYDGIICFWDAKTGEKIDECKIIIPENRMINSAVFSPDGNKIALGFYDGLICMVDIENRINEIKWVEEGHKSPIFSLAFNPESDKIIAASWNGTLRLYDAGTMKLIENLSSYVYSGLADFPSEQKIFYIESSPISGTYLHIVDIETKDHASVELYENSPSIFGKERLAVDPNCNEIAVGYADGNICIWDAQTGEIIGSPVKQQSSVILSLKYSQDGGKIISSSDKTIGVWDYKPNFIDKQSIKYYDLADAISTDGRLMAYADSTYLLIFNVENGKQICNPIMETDSICFLKFSPDNKKITSSTKEGTIRIWDLETNKQIGKTFEGSNVLFPGITFSPNWKLIAYVSNDSTIHVYNTESGERITGPFNSHLKVDNVIKFSSTGKLMASTPLDKSVINIWDLESGEQVGEPLKTPMAGFKNMVFSPDENKILYSYSNENTYIYDLETNSHIGLPVSGQIPFHYNNLFTPDGRLFISYGTDNGHYIIRLIELDTGEVFLEIPINDELFSSVDFTTKVLSCSFNTNGDKIITCFNNGNVYTFEWKQLQELLDKQRERFKDRKLTPRERRQYYLE